MAEYKRINLCFNIDNEEQARVYEFLMSQGKQKTNVVVKALLPQEIKIDSDDELYKAEIMQKIQCLMEKIDNLHYESKGSRSFSENSSNTDRTNADNRSRFIDTDESIKEMSEDAFSAIAGLIR